jgi:hypothetical protein
MEYINDRLVLEEIKLATKEEMYKIHVLHMHENLKNKIERVKSCID